MSIIGNPIMAGGAGGRNVSSIIITGLLSTDTITCTKDGKSYTATWDSTAHHWEIVGLPLGTFTLTATNGTKTKTETVLIDITGVYEVEMALKLWLYRDGDECEYVTGGWQSRARGDFDHMSSQLPTFIKNTSNFTVSIDSGDGAYSGSIETIKDIDLTKYSTLYVSCVSGQASTWSAVNAWACSRIVDKIVNDFAASVELVSCDGTNTTKYINNVVKSGDISEITGLYDIVVSVDGKSQVTIDKIWLE